MFTLMRSAVATPFRWFGWLRSHHVAGGYRPGGEVDTAVPMCPIRPPGARSFCLLREGHTGPHDVYEW